MRYVCTETTQRWFPRLLFRKTNQHRTQVTRCILHRRSIQGQLEAIISAAVPPRMLEALYRIP
jgi:hypothetical protein